MESAYLRERICTYVLHEGPIPINPWMGGGYFLLRTLRFRGEVRGRILLRNVIQL